MAIEKMKRLRLVAVKSERETLLRELMLLGCVHIKEPPAFEKDSEEALVFTKEMAGLNQCKAEHDELISGIELLNKYAPAKTGLFSAKSEISLQSIMDESSLGISLALAEKLMGMDDKIKRITAEESRLRGLVETLKPWESLDIPLELSETKNCAVLHGTVPATVDLKTLEAELAVNESESQILKISSDKDLHYIILIAMKENLASVLELVRKFGFSPSSVSNMKGTAKENIARLEVKLKELITEKEALTEQIVSSASVRNDMKLCADRLLTKSERAENSEKLLCTDSTINFEGWIPVREEKQLANVLSNFNCAWETFEPTQEDIPEVPVRLSNNALTGPFSMLTEMYSLPAYNGIDPNPFLMVFFSLFFGIIFADLGYGLIMLIAGMVYNAKVKPRGVQTRFSGILIICGITTSVFGVLSGSFFGDAIAKIASMYGHTVSLPALIDPLNNPLQVLIGSLALGFIHLFVATAINGYMLVRDGQWKDAVLDIGSLWLFLAGIALGALGITWYVAYAGTLMVVISQGRSSPTIGGKIGNGLFGLYSTASGWFGDILSYSRLFALMLAGAVIGSVFNTLGTLTGNIFTFAILFLLGHALNFGLSILGAFVHSLRLQYLEFFGKFYREGGKPFQPLAVKTNYFNIIEED
ncbi:MAG: V-type ATP synthase subunit I [Oscillospiraceae bacterium]|nr:V-type ATP synthase subunit I [Oscillospiraceae bacterium]